jgi:hypothetical protein
MTEERGCADEIEDLLKGDTQSIRVLIKKGFGSLPVKPKPFINLYLPI